MIACNCLLCRRPATEGRAALVRDGEVYALCRDCASGRFSEFGFDIEELLAMREEDARRVPDPPPPQRSRARFVEVDGRRLAIAEAAEALGINEGTLWARWERGDRGERLARPPQTEKARAWGALR